jgi:hypothetical protein
LPFVVIPSEAEESAFRFGLHKCLGARQPGAPHIDSDVWDIVRRTTVLFRIKYPPDKVVILSEAKNPRILPAAAIIFRSGAHQPQQINVSSPKTANPRVKQANSRGRIITSNLLSLNQDQNRKPPPPEAFPLEQLEHHQLLCYEYFEDKLSGMNSL